MTISQVQEEAHVREACKDTSCSKVARPESLRILDAAASAVDVFDLVDRLRALNDPKQRELPSADALPWILTALSSVGIALGIFTGWSASPVVAAMLPLIFGLAGGTTGFALIQRAMPAAKLRLLALSLISFSATSVIGAFLGVSMRS